MYRVNFTHAHVNVYTCGYLGCLVVRVTSTRGWGQEVNG